MFAGTQVHELLYELFDGKLSESAAAAKSNEELIRRRVRFESRSKAIDR